MDEQLLRARLAALDAAARMRSSVATATIIEDAESFERWLLRPAPVDASKVNDGAPERAECGAFLRPAWYTDAMQARRRWLVCGGMHQSDGWHIDDTDPAEIGTFASHHWISHADGRQCSCGAYEFPCPRASRTDMHT